MDRLFQHTAHLRRAALNEPRNGAPLSQPEINSLPGQLTRAMISIVLYGRNDSYGYNLHKRAALSLNCMAEVLTHKDDEILFVDYNTPDDFPTFPEAIQDTLTDRAKRVLRVLRVRSRHHERFRNRTHLVALEPVARNVAVRRSNPANRWILSTNTDMIFVPRKRRGRTYKSLSESVQSLEDGFYHLPRFEIPESLWEMFDRHAPASVIETVRAWGEAFHLNEVVLGPEMIRYDAPGDFQLMLRSDLFEMCGFDERMILGWHVDSNIAKRLFLRYGRVGDIFSEFFGYHCDHTRQVTPAHRPGAVANDIDKFVTSVTDPKLSFQAESWGMPEETIEEIRLKDFGSLYTFALQSAIGESMREPSELRFTPDAYDRIEYDPKHVLPFLSDIFVNYPRNTKLGWFGARRELLDLFCITWRTLGYSEPILLDEQAVVGKKLPAIVKRVDRRHISEAAEVFVFDFGSPEETASEPQAAADLAPGLATVVSGFHAMTRAERRRLASGSGLPRRFITINAIHNRFEQLVREAIAAAQAPIATRMRQGYLLPPMPRKLLAMMPVGGAGIREGPVVRSAANTPGFMVYGPPLKLLGAGRYRLRVEMEVDDNGHTDPPIIWLEVLTGPYLLAHHLMSLAEQQSGVAEIVFRMEEPINDEAEDSTEFRVFTDGQAQICLKEISLEPIGLNTPGEDANEFDWLTLMKPSKAGQRIFDLANARVRIQAPQGSVGHVAFGPRYPFAPGVYRLRFQVAATEPISLPDEQEIGRVDVLVGQNRLKRQAFTMHALRAGEFSLIIEVPAVEQADLASKRLDIQIWTNGKAGFELASVFATKIAAKHQAQAGAVNGVSSLSDQANSPPKVGLVSKHAAPSDAAAQWYRYWTERLELPARSAISWQYSFVMQVLHERNVLRLGKRGLFLGKDAENLLKWIESVGARMDRLSLDRLLALRAHLQDDTLEPSIFLPPIPEEDAWVKDLRNRLGTYDFVISVSELSSGSIAEKIFGALTTSARFLHQGGVMVHTLAFASEKNGSKEHQPGVWIPDREQMEILAERLNALDVRFAGLELVSDTSSLALKKRTERCHMINGERKQRKTTSRSRASGSLAGEAFLKTFGLVAERVW